MRPLLLLAAIAAVSALSTSSQVQEPLELDSPSLREAKAEAEMAREALRQARQQAEEARTAYQELLATSNSSATAAAPAEATSAAEELVAARKAVQTARNQYSAFVNKEVEDKVEESEHSPGSSALTVQQAEAEVAKANKEVLEARAAYNRVLSGQVPEENLETVAQAIIREAAERKLRKPAGLANSVEGTEKTENAQETYDAFREEAVNALNYMKAKLELKKLRQQYEGLTHQAAAPKTYKEEYEQIRSQAKQDVETYLSSKSSKHGASPMNLLASSSSIVDTKTTSAHNQVISMRKEAQEALTQAKQRSSTIGLLSTSSKTTPTNFETMTPHEQVEWLRTDAMAAMKEYEEAKVQNELVAQNKASTFTRAGQLNTVSALLGDDLPSQEETKKISNFLSSQVNQAHDYATKRFLEKVVSGLQTAAAHEDASVHVDVTVKTPSATNSTRVVEQNSAAATSNHGSGSDLLESTNYVGTGLIIGCSVGVVAGMAITRFVLMKL